jgi:hypothetical protein
MKKGKPFADACLIIALVCFSSDVFCQSVVSANSLSIFPEGTQFWVGLTPQIPYQLNTVSDLDSMKLHYAVDLVATSGTEVLAPVEGTVSFEDCDYPGNWLCTAFVKSGPVTYYLRHLNPALPPLTLIRKNKVRQISKGELLGFVLDAEDIGPRGPPNYALQTVVPKSHIHFGAYDCQKKVIVNTLPLLRHFDPEPPMVMSINTYRRATKRRISGQLLSGEVALSAFVVDRIPGSKMPYNVVMAQASIYDQSGRTVWENTAFEFREIRIDAEDESTFCRGPYPHSTLFPNNTSKTVVAATYDEVRVKNLNGIDGFNVWLTNQDTKYLDTRRLKNGPYRLVVVVTDAHGNSAEKSFEIDVSN